MNEDRTGSACPEGAEDSSNQTHLVGPSTRTPHRSRSPTRASSKLTVAAKAGQPSSATISSMGVSTHPFQLPARRALRNTRLRMPVR